MVTWPDCSVDASMASDDKELGLFFAELRGRLSLLDGISGKVFSRLEPSVFSPDCLRPSLRSSICTERISSLTMDVISVLGILLWVSLVPLFLVSVLGCCKSLFLVTACVFCSPLLSDWLCGGGPSLLGLPPCEGEIMASIWSLTSVGFGV